jgi:hypothetical protein
MLTSMTNIQLPPSASRTEWKVRAAALATYLVSLAGVTLLDTTVTDYVHSLPDWLESVVYPMVPALGALLAGRAARTKPDYLSPSTVTAVQEWLRDHAPRR